MKFKGVETKKGNNRGDVIEYSPEEKIRVALGEAITKHETFADYLVHPAKVQVSNVISSKKGDALKKLWQNNVYEGSGRIDVSRRHKEKDRLLKPLTFDFSIKVEDCLCENGLPDLKTVALQLTPV